MLKLHGFSLSNYYNKVKFILLEKGVPFDEVFAPLGGGEGAQDKTPLGKIPFLETEAGFLCESQVMADYIEARWPEPRLMPADPWQAAKVRELIAFMDLHVELCARQLYPQAFFGATLPEGVADRVKGELVQRLAAFRRLARFAPFAAGEHFTQADCAVFVSLPLAAMASRAVCGEDLVAAVGIDWKGYVKLIEQRPAAQKVVADRKADQARALAAARVRQTGQG
ncbi:glutathione S-transferase [Aquabacterium sp.]|uniref:glutathione S-transferase family protein n=1 Tax=Aquabacterium sp. TaxID=1872578 RepID=UPI0025B946DB|nr:glutathione S-transferase [Aquabacterium sp.]